MFLCFISFPSKILFYLMSSSSNSIRVLPLLSGKGGRHTNSHNLVLASIENIKRISELNR